MNVFVNEQPKRFWLSTIKKSGKHEWRDVIGHEIKVGDYTFSIACIDLALRVSEKTTGYKAFEIKLTPLELISTSTKKGTMEFYREFVGERLKWLINKTPNFEDRIKRVQEKQKKELGDMPAIEDVDEALIMAQVSELTH